jgi:HNH endonuclease
MNLLLKKIFSRISREPNGCWLWLRSKSPKGYGRISRRGYRSPQLVHRVVYELCRGAIPEGMYVCHKCDTPSCCNPDHLFIGSQTSNMADMVSKSRQGQPRGLATSSAWTPERRAAWAEHVSQRAEAKAQAVGVSRSTHHYCRDCEQWLPHASFHKANPNRLKDFCKSCRNRRERATYALQRATSGTA